MYIYKEINILLFFYWNIRKNRLFLSGNFAINKDEVDAVFNDHENDDDGFDPVDISSDIPIKVNDFK